MRRPVGVAALAAVLCLALPSLAAAAAPRHRTPGAIPPAPGAVPDGALDRTIHEEALRVVTAGPAAALAQAAGDADRAAAALRRGLGAELADRATAAAAARTLRAATGAATTAAAALGAGQVALRGDRAAVTGDSSRIQTLAVEWYVNGLDPTSSPDAGLTASRTALAAEGALAAVTDDVEVTLRQDREAAAAEARTVTADAVRLQRARGAEAADGATSSRQQARVSADAATVSGARAALAGADRAAAAAEHRRQAAIAAFDGPEGGGPAPVPTILGRPALDATQLVAWYRSSGFVDLTTAPIGELAAWYIAEGDAEGVRGDVAFAQAVVETGGFASPDAANDSNFAGIGHCDTCAHGLRFPGPHAGVRGQIQLLRTYAEAGLTAAGLADPPVLPALDPATQTARGCCRTWNALTGHWATDPNYGLTVLDLYQSMLASSLASPGP